MQLGYIPYYSYALPFTTTKSDRSHSRLDVYGPSLSICLLLDEKTNPAGRLAGGKPVFNFTLERLISKRQGVDSSTAEPVRQGKYIRERGELEK